MNGKVIRSCTRKMKTVPEFSEITTIEGIGTPRHLHPLQQAWITYGAAQCGFCSPGFIVSSYQLLAENPSPSRDDVREWFRKNRNICRCTGYKPLVNAVMAAAKVMRGEASMKDITYDFAAEKEIYGSRRPRPTALVKVTGLADYGDDIKLKMPEGTAHLAVVISEVHHAKILSIDTREAEAMPGVIKVLTAKDVKGTNNMASPAHTPRQERKRHHGVPRHRRQKDLPARRCGGACGSGHRRACPRRRQGGQAESGDPALLHDLPRGCYAQRNSAPRKPANFYMEQPVFKGRDTAEVFEEAAFVAEGSFHSQHEPHLPMEPDVVQAYWGIDGMMTIQCKCQSIGENREAIAMATGVPKDNIRMILNYVGGSFGYSTSSNTYALVVTAVQNLNMPAR